jgi:ATP-dependent Clp protease, protease subunit
MLQNITHHGIAAMTENTETHYFEFVGPIDEANARNVMACLQLAVNSGSRKIHLSICSPGGRTLSGMLLYNHLKRLPVELTTHNSAFVESAAVMMYLAGAKRTTNPISKFMLHRPTQKLPPTSDYTADYLQFIASGLRYDETAMRKVLQEETKMEITDLETVFRIAGINYQSEDAVKLGIAHSIEFPIRPPGAIVQILGC